jgi:hypothetical protein
MGKPSQPTEESLGSLSSFKDTAKLFAPKGSEEKHKIYEVSIAAGSS